jgi:hypothetical protein
MTKSLYDSRAERTGGDPAVSGIDGGELAGVKPPAGTPWTNSLPQLPIGMKE